MSVQMNSNGCTGQQQVHKHHHKHHHHHKTNNDDSVNPQLWGGSPKVQSQQDVTGGSGLNLVS